MYTTITIVNKNGESFVHKCDSREWNEYLDEAKKIAPCTIMLSNADGDVFQIIKVTKD